MPKELSEREQAAHIAGVYYGCRWMREEILKKLDNLPSDKLGLDRANWRDICLIIRDVSVILPPSPEDYLADAQRRTDAVHEAGR